MSLFNQNLIKLNETEITEVNPADYLQKLQKHGVNVSESDLKVYLDSGKTIKDCKDDENFKERFAKVLTESVATYLSIDAGSQVNAAVLSEIGKSIILEFGDKLTFVQLKHAFNLFGRGKIDLDMNMFGSLKFKPVIDLVRIYCGMKNKAVSAYKKERSEEIKLLQEPILSKEDAAKHLFQKWDETNTDKFGHNFNKLYAVGYGKNFINCGLVNVKEDQQQRIYEKLRNFEITKLATISNPIIQEDDGTVLYEKIKVQKPLQYHPDFEGMTFDDIFTYCVLFAHFKNKNKNK